MTLSQMRILRQRSLASQVHDAICDSLASGELAPGERIVVERLAERLGVSPTPVREAVARLVQEGLIEDASNGKLRIVPLTPSYVRDTFQVRGVLEGLAAELAALRITPGQIDGLREALATTEVALVEGKHEAHVRTDALLHRTVAEASGNAVLAREFRALAAHVDYIRGYSQRHIGDHIRRSHDEHTRIVELLGLGDGEAARRAMERHIRETCERIVRIIDFQTAGSPL